MRTIVINGMIEGAQLSLEGGSALVAWVQINYGGASQAFGGAVLYLTEDCRHHRLNGPAGHFIAKVMQVAGVERWDELPGRPIRVRASDISIAAIGHFLKDDWFLLEDEMKRCREEAGA